MSSNIAEEEHDPVANLNLQPARSILKSTRSMDDPRQDSLPDTTNGSTTGMTRSESKSHKIPHFDEMNIIATYHPADKDYGHMKIEEPKTPYAPNDVIDEESVNEETTAVAGVDPDALAEKLNESKAPSHSSHRMRLARKSSDEDVEPSSNDSEHRKQFEDHRKKHYNEFEVVRARKREIEEELRALEQEENPNQSASTGNINVLSSPRSSTGSIKPILVHHSRDSSSSSGHHHHHHVHVEANANDDETKLTPEEQERKKQFELKRKQHYNEFRQARSINEPDDEPATTE